MDIAAILDEAIDLEEAGRLTEALARFEQVLTVQPGNAVARAGALGARAAKACEEDRAEDAIALCNQALTSSAHDLRALTVRARALGSLGRHREALADCLKVLAYAPDFADALATRGAAFVALGETEAGVDDLEAAAGLNPGFQFLLGQALHYALQICRWRDFDDKLARTLEAVNAGVLASRPFWLLSLPSTRAQQRNCAAAYFGATVKAVETMRPQPETGAKIRLGYFSSDLYTHATAHLVMGLFEAHDRARFDVLGFSLGGDARDPVQLQLARTMDKFIDCAGLSDTEVVARARGEGVQIALDLNVHIGRQPRLFARGVAPLQVNYLGYPGTSGAPCYDYVIGDPVLTPFAHSADYSERIVQLPHCYQPNSFPRYGALAMPLRKTLGLPDKAFVFCCFNDCFKVLPAVFDRWMRILRAVDGSVLWLLQSNAVAVRNLRAEAERRGIGSERLIFAPRLPIGQHLARHGAADLFLDTWPYNAHTTASDALWAGLPIVTCAGDTFASRVAASALTAAGIPELITHSLEEYEWRALELARDSAQLAGIRERLRLSRASCALFDTARYARNLECAYTEMWARHRAGLAPCALAITEPAT